jgi:hypothetical protein
MGYFGDKIVGVIMSKTDFKALLCKPQRHDSEYCPISSFFTFWKYEELPSSVLQYSLAFYATRPAYRILIDLITVMTFVQTRKFEDLYHICITLGPVTIHLSILFSQPNLFVSPYMDTFINI